MNLKARVKRFLPAPVYNQILLTMPCLYRSGLFNYETNLEADDGITDLLTRLSEVKYLGGEVIECGSSRCGTSIIIANYLRQQGIEKKIYACDSFEGFDPAELTRERASGLTKARQNVFTSTSYRYVLQKIDRLGLSSQVVPVKGFFETTLPDLARFNEFCFALIDCDLYNSVLYCANEVWPRITPGGCIVFDDYVSDEFRGARLAIDEFVKGAVPKIETYGLMRRLFYVKKASQSGTLD
jgi:O-methyltransferase